MKPLLSLALLLAGCAALAAADGPAGLPAADASSSELRPMIEQYSADSQSLERAYPIRLSETRRKRFDRFYTERQAALSKVDFDRLSEDGRIDYLLFRNHLERERKQLELDAVQMTEMEPLIPFAKTIINLEEARRRMEPVDSRKAAQALADMVRAIEAARQANGKDSKVKASVANRAAARLASLRNDLKAWYSFYNGYDPLFTWWMEDPYKRADSALNNYVKYLREQLAGLREGDRTAIVGDPAGREALMSDLAYNMIPYTPEELIALARKEYDWCEKEMIRASREMGDGDDWRKALEEVKSDFVEPGKQPELVRRLADEAVEYVTQRDLVTVPPLAREDWWEEMLSPESQLTAPFFLGGDLILVAFPTNTMTEDQKLMSMRGNNVHFARSTVFHELIPGHHLQGFMSARYRAYRAPFATPFWSEGNAFYWELLLWDMGFAKTPQDRIGMLFWHMHRSARIIFSLSFHLGQMTAQECVDFLVNRVGFERDNALAEVRRSFDGSYEPIYQCAYMLGALQFHALHHELVDSGKMTNRAFHDAILQENSIPVEMIRADLTHQKLTRDYKPNWKFYGEKP
jgi:uncharacterized protein (DUF885 family)